MEGGCFAPRGCIILYSVHGQQGPRRPSLPMRYHAGTPKYLDLVRLASAHRCSTLSRWLSTGHF